MSNPRPTAESASAPHPIGSWRPRPDHEGAASRPTRNPLHAETHADVDTVALEWIDARNPLVVPAVPEYNPPHHQMHPASGSYRESLAGVEVFGREENAGYIRDSSTGTGFSASNVPGSIQIVVELRSRVPIGALAPLYDQAGRAAP